GANITRSPNAARSCAVQAVSDDEAHGPRPVGLNVPTCSPRTRATCAAHGSPLWPPADRNSRRLAPRTNTSKKGLVTPTRSTHEDVGARVRGGRGAGGRRLAAGWPQRRRRQDLRLEAVPPRRQLQGTRQPRRQEHRRGARREAERGGHQEG